MAEERWSKTTELGISPDQSQRPLSKRELLEYTKELSSKVTAFRTCAENTLTAALKELVLHHSWMTTYSTVLLMKSLTETELFGSFSALTGIIVLSLLEDRSTRSRIKRMQREMGEIPLRKVQPLLMLSKHKSESLIFENNTEIHALLNELKQEEDTAKNAPRKDFCSDIAKEIKKSFSVLSASRNRLSPEFLKATADQKKFLLETGVEPQFGRSSLLFAVALLTSYAGIEATVPTLASLTDPIAGAFLSAFIATAASLPILRFDEIKAFLSRSKALTKKMKRELKDLKVYEESFFFFL